MFRSRSERTRPAVPHRAALLRPRKEEGTPRTVSCYSASLDCSRERPIEILPPRSLKTGRVMAGDAHAYVTALPLLLEHQATKQPSLHTRRDNPPAPLCSAIPPHSRAPENKQQD